ncbi:crotonase/enoyl-CoA hydratase family protein [Phyllobacterium sp. 0TCS1.6C]|uniref:crotonase/enoyl-CoA hydratase family protein n=1 Tax=unclassified Phyllobacterium TaxID=2638441 RepID=UPI0022656D56|nr:MULTISPECIES: crotonase/enoyl-CoA hydratase family protein [unclassified Phyllobacterium]MCX8281409.1 crotonase/enoyl-CoA hydratase family protein [Phyllobacterium sp. 0TCS1.6C]MCX8295935.1 crotonase/enoyl-CoA hydratase family protein [Phyllobacterium sp. 0TCS1.6A]
MSDHIKIERQGAVQLIRMNRPEKKNALTRAMYAAMTAALVDSEADASIRANLFLGVPGAFSSGNDLQDFMAFAISGQMGNEVFDFIMALGQARKPLLAGVDGLAIGIGATLHFHCDLTFATPQSLFRTPFVDLGLVPEAASSLLGPRLMGPQQAFAFLAKGDDLSAEEAKAAGLVYRIVDAAQLEETALAAATEIAAKPPEAMQITRDLLRGPREAVAERMALEARHFAERLQSEEARAAMMNFLARKKG